MNNLAEKPGRKSTGQFEKGHEGFGNVGGLLSRKMKSAYLADFKKHGMGAIRKARQDDPIGYLRLGASLLPKDASISISHDFSQVLAVASDLLATGRAPSLEVIEGQVIEQSAELQQEACIPADKPTDG